MKKSLIALAVLAASGAAMAQSSVTLYGVADAGVTYLNGADNWSGVTSGNNLTSRLGFRGVEDLGGGLKANFVIEGGFNLDNGDGASGYAGAKAGEGFQFKRRSTVGLSGGFGEVRMGRELTAAFNATARYDVFGSVGIGQSRLWADGGVVDASANATAVTTNQRISNALTYVAPDFSGFKFGLNYGFGETTASNSDSGYLGAGLTYDNGPLSLGLGLERLNNGANSVAASDIHWCQLSMHLAAKAGFGQTSAWPSCWLATASRRLTSLPLRTSATAITWLQRLLWVPARCAFRTTATKTNLALVLRPRLTSLPWAMCMACPSALRCMAPTPTSRTRTAPTCTTWALVV